MNKYYVGLDIGTNSVGWAVTDEKYNLCKFKKKDMWGIRLFESGKTAEERRGKRTARRRLQRKKQRIDLLQELFAEEMAKVDTTFFLRLNESRLHMEDKPVQEKYPLFTDESYSDIDYYKQYPTIFHLRKELMENPKEHDIRLVYLAIHHILKNRGHFLIDGDLSRATEFGAVFEQLIDMIETELAIGVFVESKESFEDVLRDKKLAKSAKAKRLSSILTVDEGEYTKDETKRRKAAIDAICKFIVGNKGDLAKIFEEELTELEKTSFSFSDASYDESVRPSLESAIADKIFIIDRMKAVYDWSVLADVLDGQEYFSFAKVKHYEVHKNNLSRLRKLMKKYCTKKVYRQFFDDCSGKVNYASYIGSVKTRGKKIDVKRCAEDDFYKELKKILQQMQVEENDRIVWEELLQQAELKRMLPLQRSKDNGAVPNQIHLAELVKILENAENYLDFLKEKGADNLTVSEKIKCIFSFRVPYYVGPLSDRHKETGANAWIVRKPDGQGKIYPWNFDEKVDREASNEAFIRRMTNKCTYLIGEDVVAKNSLLYSRYMVLNELNNLRIRGREISVGLKQDIFNHVFKNHTKVKGKQLLNYLRESDRDLQLEDLSGFDEDFKANLSSYLDFEKQVFGERIAEDRVKSMAEDIIRWKTIYDDDNSMLMKIIERKYPNELNADQLKAVRRLRYSGWGNFSEKFLCGVEGVDKDTGESFNIMEALWHTNCNLMQLLSSRFTFKEEIDKINGELTGKVTEISYDALVKDLYVSPAVKRAIWQSIQIVEEIKKVMGSEPDKIFVELARGEDNDKQRTVSRKARLLALYEGCEADGRDWAKEIEDRDERDFNSMKLYLYYTQMGRCMYTGEQISIDQLMTANARWDRDHIYPQSKIKDDSLDNLVLVRKEFNAKKSNEMISEEIQRKQKPFWDNLLKMGLITRKKYERLTRKDDFSDDELAGFINRQIVETRQSSKAVVDLLNRMYDATRVIPVKAGIVSQFRQRDLNILKSRRVNDYHHAKDAYLNIVAGDVYDARFTSNPRTWLKNQKEKNYHMNRVFDFDVYRGNTCIWEAPEGNGKKRNADGDKFGGTLDRIRKIVKQNNILYTEHTYCEKGELFIATIAKKTEGANIPLKAGLDPEKYGGYKSPNTSYFAFIEFDGKKGERIRNIMEVPIYVANMLPHKPDAYLEYCTKIKGLKNVSILRGCIRKNALIRVDGYPMRIRGVDSKNVLFKNNLQPRLDSCEELIRHIEKYLEKNVQFDVDEKKDKLSEESLINLYDILTEKLKTVYEKRPSNQWKTLEVGRERFLQLSLRDKAKVINQILNMVRCDINTKADLTSVGGSANAGSISVNKNTAGKSRLILVNQSVTGLFENRIEL